MQTYSPTSYTPTRTPQMHVCLRIRTCKCARTHARILACKILLNLQFAKLSHNSRFCALFSFHPMTSAPSLNQSLIPGVPHIFARTHLCVRVASTVKIIPRACHHTGPAATHMHMSVARLDDSPGQQSLLTERACKLRGQLVCAVVPGTLIDGYRYQVSFPLLVFTRRNILQDSEKEESTREQRQTDTFSHCFFASEFSMSVLPYEQTLPT